MIYNDQEVVVVKLFAGDAPRSLTIRNIGGIVGDTRYEIEGLEPLRKGADYLVYLRAFETPTQEGMETAISFVGQEQGIFESADDGFVNHLGLKVTTKSLDR